MLSPSLPTGSSGTVRAIRPQGCGRSERDSRDPSSSLPRFFCRHHVATCRGQELGPHFPLRAPSPGPPGPRRALGCFCESASPWDPLWVDMGQLFLPFCFWTGDCGCCWLQTLRVHNMGSEKVPQDLSHREVQQLRSVFHAVLCQRMLACSPDLKGTQR